ncbi:MAG: Re/Si-specific NAD(P)(+) transhydrogenase subunit alpha [Leptospiraceae bacterium]|nr:Re/Si-specific NAD(P)(+) transhydrogenase subunit alpha [Leptospiraceae bacterium]
MKVAVAKETTSGEKRVALIPESVKKLCAKGFAVAVEKGAGEGAQISDSEYSEAGAQVVERSQLSDAELLVKVRPPSVQELENCRDQSWVIALLDPIQRSENLPIYERKKLTTFALEFIPRITLAQSMDVLSSMASVAGYRAVLLAAHEFGRFFPMLMTAAGTIPPAKAFVLGAGVAGLQAIATARRLGAVVEAFDVRAAAAEQVESLGAKFVKMEITEDLQDEQGYAKEASPEFLARQKELLHKHIAKSDIVITTAQVFGKKAPVLIEDYMVKSMKPGSVIVDLASETGGNCVLSRHGETVEVNGVKILAPANITSGMASAASRMFSKNVENLLLYLFENSRLVKDFASDEILKRSIVTRDGMLVSEIVKKALNRS